MPRHLEQIQGPPEKILSCALDQNPVRLQRLDPQRKAAALEKIRIVQHGHRVGVAGHRTPVAPLHGRRIGRVVPMPVR